VPEPALDGAEIDAGPQGPRCKRSAELVKPELLLIQLGPFGASLQTIEKIQLGPTAGCWENEVAGLG
jgi:hypothetical protein